VSGRESWAAAGAADAGAARGSWQAASFFLAAAPDAGKTYALLAEAAGWLPQVPMW
jgi:hypothetical protein